MHIWACDVYQHVGKMERASVLLLSCVGGFISPRWTQESGANLQTQHSKFISSWLMIISGLDFMITAHWSLCPSVCTWYWSYRANSITDTPSRAHTNACGLFVASIKHHTHIKAGGRPFLVFKDLLQPGNRPTVWVQWDRLYSAP